MLEMNESKKRKPGVVDQDALLHWVDVILDIVEDHSEEHIYIVACQIMEHLVQTDLDHNKDKSAGGN